MNDPTGIGAQILAAIGAVYWSIALISFGAALWIPKTGRTKTILSLSVVGVFFGIPALFTAKLRFEENARRSAIQTACTTSHLSVKKMSPVPGFYASSNALLIVKGATNKEQLESDQGLDHVLNYLVERKMSYIELDMPMAETRRSSEVGLGNALQSQAPYIRLSIAPAGTPQCAASERWSAEYPAQRLPGLRRLGLLSTNCIAVEGAYELRSRYRISAKIAPAVLYKETRYGLWEHALEIRDADTSSIAATFRLFVSKDRYGNQWIRCNKATEAYRFEKVVPIAPDPRIVNLREVKDESSDFPVKSSATPLEIKDVGRLPGLERVNLTNIISDDGMIWFENNLGEYFLTIVSGGELRKTLIRVGGVKIGWITGLQVTDSLIRFVARTDFHGSSWLVEYSRKGEPLRALTLTQEQVDALK